MRFFAGIVLIVIFFSCNKVIDVQLPPYTSELVVEMYLEDGKQLRCAVSESLPYTDTGINKPVDSALVIFSDGTHSDTLKNVVTEDYETGRTYNYFSPEILVADNSKTYSLYVSDGKRSVTGTTTFSQPVVAIDSIDVRATVNKKDTFSIGVIISDPPKTNNYYRFLITKKLNDFISEPTDLSVNDNSFNGKQYSFYTEPAYARNDSVIVRVYSLQKEHYDYIQSTRDARSSNFNPFSQPALIKSNVSGGIGIFTSIRFVQRLVIIK